MKRLFQIIILFSVAAVCCTKEEYIITNYDYFKVHTPYDNSIVKTEEVHFMWNFLWGNDVILPYSDNRVPIYPLFDFYLYENDSSNCILHKKQLRTSIDVNDLSFGNTYYWKVKVRVNEDEYIESELRKFYVEKTYDGNVTLRTQDELEVFGSNNYNFIDGSLTITGMDEDPILDLSALSSLHRLGNLTIRNTDMTEITGFPHLQEISEFCQIIGNSKLTSLGGFEQIEALGYFHITDNPVLTTISAFLNLSEIKGFRITGNSELNYLPEMNHLKRVNRYIEIWYNDNLKSVGSFDSLILVKDHFDIINNKSLSDYCGIRNYVINDLSESNRLTIRWNLTNPTREEISLMECN